MFYNAFFIFRIIPVSYGMPLTIYDLNLTYNNINEIYASTFKLGALVFPYTKINIPIFTLCGNERDKICWKIQNYIKNSFLVSRPILGDFIIIYHFSVSKRRLDIVKLIDDNSMLSLLYIENGNPTLQRAEPILTYRYSLLQEKDALIYIDYVNKAFTIAENEIENCF